MAHVHVCVQSVHNGTIARQSMCTYAILPKTVRAWLQGRNRADDRPCTVAMLH